MLVRYKVEPYIVLYRLTEKARFFVLFYHSFDNPTFPSIIAINTKAFCIVFEKLSNLLCVQTMPSKFVISRELEEGKIRGISF